METNVKELELLGLSENDFDLIIEALENLPNKDMAGDMIGELLTRTLMKEDEDDPRFSEFKKKERRRKKKKRTDKKQTEGRYQAVTKQTDSFQTLYEKTQFA